MVIEEYADANGRNLFRRSFERLDERSQARVIAGIARMEQGNFSNAGNLGRGLWERRFLGRGSGPRLYYSLIGEDLTLLLVAGDKSSSREQQADIDLARAYLDEWTGRVR
jgi:putative addiction module killer protein